MLLPAGGEDDAPRDERPPVRRREREAVPARASRGHAPRDGGPRRRRRGRPPSSASSTVRARSVAGKSLPVSSRFSATPRSREEGDRLRDAEAAQHLADGGRRRAGEGALVHLVVGDVAAAAAGDEDLRAQRPRAVHEHAPVRAPAPAAWMAGHQAGRARAHHRDAEAGSAALGQVEGREHGRRGPTAAGPCARCGRWTPPCSGRPRARSRRRGRGAGRRSSGTRACGSPTRSRSRPPAGAGGRCRRGPKPIDVRAAAARTSGWKSTAARPARPAGPRRARRARR